MGMAEKQGKKGDRKRMGEGEEERKGKERKGKESEVRGEEGEGSGGKGAGKTGKEEYKQEKREKAGKVRRRRSWELFLNCIWLCWSWLADAP